MPANDGRNQNKQTTKTMTNIETFKQARRVSTPLMVIKTPDPAATMAGIIGAYGKEQPPFVSWDCSRGFIGLNADGKISAAAAPECQNPVTAMEQAMRMPGASAENPRGAVVFALNLHLQMADPTVRQAVWNLRDAYKSDRRALVILAPQMELPAELVNDVLVMDEPLPSPAELAAIVAKTAKDASLKVSEADAAAAVAATTGLSAFPAEQAIAMSLSPDGINIPLLWDRKRAAINATPGLAVWSGGGMFDDIAGLANLKQFLTRFLKGKRKPNVIVYIDEIEKAIAGFGTDTSGATDDQVGALLSFMQDNACDGMLLFGPAGTGKSEVTKAAGNEGDGVPVIQFDLGGMKGSLVGESEAKIRGALKTVKAMGQDRILVVATCNSTTVLPPELFRRFKTGRFFLDLPGTEERAAIWKLYRRKYGVGLSKQGKATKEDTAQPNDADWTGAEIKQCCEFARDFDVTLTESAKYIVPVARSASEVVTRLRQQASGRFIDASKEGLYQFRPLDTETTSGQSNRAIHPEAD